MRRWLCALQIGVLLPVLCCGVASAAMNTFDPPAVNLSARLFARCFGESDDRVASFSAVRGDAIAESPLRGLALRVDLDTPAIVTALPNLAVRLPMPHRSAAPAFAAPVVNISDAAYSLPLQSAPAISYYQSAAPVPSDAPIGRAIGVGAVHVAPADPAFSLASPVSADSTDALGAAIDVPVQLGRLHFSPHAQASFLQLPDDETPSLGDRTVGAGATIDVRAGHRNLGVDLSSTLEHATLAQPQFSTSKAPNVGLTGEALPVFVPAYADVSAHTFSTGVTVPLTRSLTANVQYDTQHLLGGYGSTPGLTPLDANNTIYGAQLTFKLPKSASAISLSAHQFRYQDNLIPANAVTQTNANLNYTVKF
jgi:hypothetical protein